MGDDRAIARTTRKDDHPAVTFTAPGPCDPGGDATASAGAGQLVLWVGGANVASPCLYAAAGRARSELAALQRPMLVAPPMAAMWMPPSPRTRPRRPAMTFAPLVVAALRQGRPQRLAGGGHIDAYPANVDSARGRRRSGQNPRHRGFPAGTSSRTAYLPCREWRSVPGFRRDVVVTTSPAGSGSAQVAPTDRALAAASPESIPKEVMRVGRIRTMVSSNRSFRALPPSASGDTSGRRRAGRPDWPTRSAQVTSAGDGGQCRAGSSARPRT
jgi:hypothetical protein